MERRGCREKLAWLSFEFSLKGQKTAAVISVRVSGLWSEILTVPLLPLFPFMACSRMNFLYLFQQGTVLGSVNKLSTHLINLTNMMLMIIVFSFKVLHHVQLVGVGYKFYKSGSFNIIVFAGDIICLDLVSPIAWWLPHHWCGCTIPVFSSSAVPWWPQRESLSKVMISQ